MAGPGDRAAGSERGFSLLLALWALSLLAFLAITISQSSGRHARHVRLAQDLARAEAAANAGVSLAILDLMAGREDGSWRRRFPPGGLPHACQLEDTITLAIAVEDDAGKVDLNAASERLLTTLLAGTGIDLARARRLAAAIADYRDADDVRRPDGAEANDYRDAGLARPPKNAPFEAVDELHLVLGFSREDVAAVGPHVTVHAGTTGLDPAVMGAALKAIITKGSAELGLATSGGERVPAQLTATSPRRTFTVRSEARAAGVVFHRESVIQLGDDRNTHIIRSWRRADQPLAGDAPAPEPLPPC
ncbi:MAG: general secretion pathway protein GspK [Hyphomicrobiaceae bacterium]